MTKVMFYFILNWIKILYFSFEYKTEINNKIINNVCYFAK